MCSVIIIGTQIRLSACCVCPVIKDTQIYSLFIELPNYLAKKCGRGSVFGLLVAVSLPVHLVVGINVADAIDECLPLILAERAGASDVAALVIGACTAGAAAHIF